MGSEDRVVAIIPARGGSKGIKRKNLAQVAGKSLLAWAINTAQGANSVDEIFVSTDDEEIQAEAARLGANAAFLRPRKISADSSTDYEFVSHFLSHYWRENKEYPTFLVHLRPTVPIRESSEIDNAVAEIRAHRDADSLRSVNEARVSPYKMWVRDERGYGEPFIEIPGMEEAFNAPRQLLPVVLEQNCYVDIYRVSSVLRTGTLASGEILLFTTEPTVDIDTEFDLEVASAVAENRLASARNMMNNSDYRSKNLTLHQGPPMKETNSSD